MTTASRWRAAMIVVAAGLLAGRAYAADWQHPYSNIDPRNDAGNDTGDSQVDMLNAQQLNQNYRGPYYYVRPQPGVYPPRLPPLRRPLPPAYAPYPPPGY